MRSTVATKAVVKDEEGSLKPPANPVYLEVRAFGEVARQIVKGDLVEGTGTWEQSRWTDADGSAHQRDYVITNKPVRVWERKRRNDAAGGNGVEDDAWDCVNEPPFEDDETR